MQNELPDFTMPLDVLKAAGVEFILVGGAAGIVHGSARVTWDVDVVYSRSRENIARLATALAPYQPYLRGRGVPPGLPFLWDEETIRRGFNFTLTTTLGDIDLLGEVTGGGLYEELLPNATCMPAFGIDCLCVDLATLIHLKRSAGRPKDFEAIAELELLLEETDEDQNS